MDMLKAARLALEFLGGMDVKSFRADRKTQSAVLHQLLILGEAAKRVPLDVRRRFEAIPWKQIAGMRDRLIHAYDNVSVRRVWSTVRRRLPPLIRELEEICRIM